MNIKEEVEELILQSEVSGHCHWCYNKAFTKYEDKFLCRSHYEAVRKESRKEKDGG